MMNSAKNCLRVNSARTDFQNRFGCAAALVCCLLASPQQPAKSQTPQRPLPQNPQEKAAPDALATVGDCEISEQALLRWLRKTIPHYAASPDQAQPTLSSFNNSLVKGAMEHLVNRQIVLHYLRAEGLKVSTDEIKLELERLANQLEAIGKTTEDYLMEEGISKRELESEFEWEIAWRRYLARVLLDDYLKQHFDRHRRRFDQSEMRVAHLLIAVNEKRPMADAKKLAEQIYAKIRTSKPDAMEQDWNAMVSQHSQAPSRESGGELGWIRFREPMPESFSAAAFSLSVGQVSQPVETKFGVHLIRCLELREGKVGWRDAATAVKDHAAKTLFEQIVAKQRPKVAVRIR